ncbi:MAG: hypothetical protein U0521_02745 [Anaerolineae bacterium]
MVVSVQAHQPTFGGVFQQRNRQAHGAPGRVEGDDLRFPPTSANGSPLSAAA